MSTTDDHSTRNRTIVELRNRIGASRPLPHASQPVRSLGCSGLDGLLTHGGVRRGSLVEWLSSGEASGAGTVSLLAGGNVCLPDRAWILIDARRDVSPLPLAAQGFDLSRLVMIRPRSEREALGVCEEALRCEAVGLVWANVEHLSGAHFRRLQLAAEASGGIGFLLRSDRALSEPSWAEARLLVHPWPSREAAPRFRVKAVSRHGRSHRSMIDIRLDSVRGTIHEIGDARAENSLSVVS